MSSPFDAGRDSNNPGFGFGVQSDVSDDHASTVDSIARAKPPNRLGESDYREGQS